MKKTISIPAGTRQLVISHFSRSIPTNYDFEVRPANGEGQVAGTVEVKGSNWIFPKPIERQALSEQVSVHAGYWDSIFKVWVTPDQDVEVSLKSRGSAALKWLILIAFIIGLAAAMIIIFYVDPVAAP